MKRDVDNRINKKYVQLKEYVFLLIVLAAFNGFHMWIYQVLERNGVIAENPRAAINILFLFVLVTAAIIIAIIGLVRERTFIRPVRKFSEAVRKIAMGDFSVRIAPRYKDNKKDFVDVMFDDFNTMAEELDTNISKVIELNKQLIIAKEQVEEASEVKSRFFANMSHEIRTPMNAILGITEIQMENESLPEETREALSKIYNSGDMLLGIINDILDMSKIEAGKMELNPVQYEIASLINDTVQLNMMRFENKPIEFKLKIDESIPSLLIGDELRIKQILNNLLSNAAKYTHSGEVVFSVSADSALNNSDDSVTLVFQIRDTGQGLTEEQISKLFDAYERFNIDINRTVEGTGLGMSITKKLINMMSGEIFVKSEKDKGSEFTVRLPQRNTGSNLLGKATADQLEKFNLNSISNKKAHILREPMPYGSVLVVDDTEANLYVAKGLLTPYKLQIFTAESGFEAIEIIKSGRQFDIIFMDHMMPKMNGIETVKIIRSMKYNNPIVALTANAVTGQADIFLANGFDDFISKPVDTRQLNDILNKLIRDKQPPEIILSARYQYNNLQEYNTATSLKTYYHLFEELSLLEDIDVNSGLDYIGHNTEGYLDVLRYFTEKSDVYIEELENAAADKNMENYTIRAHTLKGVLGNLGAQKLSQIAAVLEKADASIRMEETQSFCSKLRNFADNLRNTSLFETLSDKNKNKIQISDTQFLKEQIINLQNACINYSFGDTKEIISSLSEYELDKETETILKNIFSFLDSFDYDKALEKIDTLLRRFM